MSTSAATLRPAWPTARKSRRSGRGSRRKVLTLFGTRPEAIKLAPVIRQLEAYGGDAFQTINVASSQHRELLAPFISLFSIRVDHDLDVMTRGQTSNQLCARLLSSLDPVLAFEEPDFILVQGDTTTALAGALAGFHLGVPVGHVEAGLRSGDPRSPFPEEMNRRLISRLATYHFAPTRRNREALLAEGVGGEQIFVTGNPVVDALQMILARPAASPVVESILEETRGLKRVVFTTHRRESFGRQMADNLRAVRRFVESHPEVALVFPVHPNPRVVEAVRRALPASHPRIRLIDPLGYDEFVTLLDSAWLIVSDSGGVQEEAPSLGKPLLILRENTERPEVLESGLARLVGGDPARLAELLEEASRGAEWAAGGSAAAENPFGRGDSSLRIAQIVATLVGLPATRPLEAL